MSAPSNRRRRDRRAGGGGHDGADERWLLTYSDMITLLMALFIVMWSISSVNISKYTELKKSLQQAFSGKILAGSPDTLTGQPAVLTSPGQTQAGSQLHIAATPDPQKAIAQSIENAAAKQDLENLRRIRRQVDAYARSHGFEGLIRTSIDERGLVIRLLTDEVLFDTGEASLKSKALPLLTKISALLAGAGIPNAVRVEGNTDDVPISTAEFHSNWELSTARADAVLEYLLAHGVAPRRLSATGYADQRPLASNATVAGRAKNRRVELVVLRRALSQGGLDS
jgi:chemotaxis protein MotB